MDSLRSLFFGRYLGAESLLLFCCDRRLGAGGIIMQHDSLGPGGHW